MNTVENMCRTNLLPDLPAEDDAFGSHRRVAEAIADLVRTDKGGKAIGLTGTWGSGKSTVITLLKAALGRQEPRGQTVFVFDAWSHERDPLRRTFLERLISFLSDQNWIRLAEWELTKASLAKRVKISETTESPRLTYGGIAFAVSILLAPIGLAILSALNSPNQQWVITATILALGPLLVFLFLWLTGKGVGTTNETPDYPWRKNVLSLLVSRSETITKTETSETPDPTSLEFQEIFHRLLSQALSNKEHRNLVIVIDNLDRVDPEKALSLWSTMQAFFDFNGHDANKWASQFWLVVPFDPNALKRLWSPALEVGDNLAKAFLEKTFQIEFKVSPPVLSDWKSYFLSQIKLAFPQHSNEEFLTIYRVYRAKRVPENLPITPREVKLFLNNLGSYHRQWQDQIPLPVQALYALFSDKIQRPEKDLITAEYLDDRIRRLISEPEWQKYLAALHFNVEPNKALEVLMAPVVETALSKGKPEDLKELREVPGFPTVCEQVVEENYNDWAKKDAVSLAMAALVIDTVGTEASEFKHIWRRLRDGVKQVQVWSEFTEEAAKGITIIFDRSRDTEFNQLKEVVVKSLVQPVQSPEETAKVQRTPEQTKSWVRGVLQLVNFIHRDGDEQLLNKLFHVPGSAGSYLEIMRHLEEERTPSDYAQYFRPEISPADVINELINTCNSGKLHENYAASVKTMLKVKIDWPWPKLISPINQRLQASNNLTGPEVSGCVRTLLLLTDHGKQKEAENSLKTVVTQGHVFHQLAQIQGDPKATAIGVLPILLHLPEGNAQNLPGNANTGAENYKTFISKPSSQPKVVEPFLVLVFEFEKIEQLLSAANSTAAIAPVVSSILEKLAVQEDAPNYLSGGILVQDFAKIAQLITPESLQNLVRVFIRSGKLVPEIEKREFGKDSAPLYILMFGNTTGQERESFEQYLINGLKSLDKKTWMTALLNQGDLIELLLILHGENAQIGLTGPFHDALREHVPKISHQENITLKFRERWSEIVNTLEDSWRATLIRNVWDDVNSLSTKIIDGILDLYEDMLFSAEVTDTLADESLRQTFSYIVERRRERELKWLARVFKEKPEFHGKARQETKNTFGDRVENALKQNLAAEIDGSLREIGIRIGLNPDDIKKQAEEEKTKG